MIETHHILSGDTMDYQNVGTNIILGAGWNTLGKQLNRIVFVYQHNQKLSIIGSFSFLFQNLP